MSFEDFFPSMPQPLRKWLPGVEFTEEALAQRPNIAAKIAQVAAAWSSVEVDVGLLLAILLDTEALTGVSMYLALSGSAAQDRVLLAAAEARLPDDMQHIMSNMLRDIRARGKERNRVVHALWSVHPTDEKKLINCPPDNIVRSVAKAYDSYSAHKTIFTSPPDPEFMGHLLVYGMPDFDDILKRLETLRGGVNVFAHQIGLLREAEAGLARARSQVLQADEAAALPGPQKTNPSESE
jgi:hypothetical protein